MFRPGIPLPGAGTEGDQPRPTEDSARHPTPAERVRTLVESSVSADLSIPGADPPLPPAPSPLGQSAPQARAVTEDGALVLLVPAASQPAQLALRAQDCGQGRARKPARDEDVTAVLELTDVAPVAVPHRIRGRAWVGGWLSAVRADERAGYARLLADRSAQHPDAAPEFEAGAANGPAPGAGSVLLRLEVGEAYVADLWGAGGVEPEDFAAARPDPLAVHEAELLQHLAEAHEEQVRGLCVLLGGNEPYCAAQGRVVPLALDRYGMRVRLCGSGARQAGSGGESDCVDARFEFSQPVGDVRQLRRQMRRLFAAADEEASR